MFKEYDQYDALGLATLIQNQELSASDVLEAALAKAEALNPSLNAIVDYFPDEARQAIAQLELDQPFAGVPFLIKDLDTDVKGHATTHGSRLFKDHRAAADCALVSKYREAGLLIFGKTNAPEFGLNASTEGRLFGPCRNPWNLQHSTGGSSGGSAAAVAAGIVPMAHASDGGGSIRIPASSCGLFGLKPSRGLVSFAPHAEGWGGLDHMHIVSRSVRDSAALLDASAGPVAGDFHRVKTAHHDSFLDAATNKERREKLKLRIGFTTTSPNGGEVDADCIKAVQRAATLCASLGHVVEEASPEYNGIELAYHCALMGISHVRVMINMRLQQLGRALSADDLEVATQGLLEVMQHASAADYATALDYINQCSRNVANGFFQQYDLWLTPTLAKTPAPLGHLFCDSAESAMDFYDRISHYTPFTGFANAMGLPAMSVPLHWSQPQLPVGVQFVGRSGEEANLFTLAAQLEQARPWFDQYKKISL